MTRAIELGGQAAAALPTDEGITQTWCSVLMQYRNLVELRRCALQLRSINRDGLAANFISGLVAAEDGDFDRARAYLRKAKDAGLDQPTYDRLVGSFAEVEEANATFPAWAHTAGWSRWGSSDLAWRHPHPASGWHRAVPYDAANGRACERERRCRW